MNVECAEAVEKWTCDSVGYYRDKPAGVARFSEDGSVLAVAFEATLTIWEPDSNAMKATLSLPTKEHIKWVPFFFFFSPLSFVFFPFSDLLLEVCFCVFPVQWFTSREVCFCVFPIQWFTSIEVCFCVFPVQWFTSRVVCFCVFPIQWFTSRVVCFCVFPFSDSLPEWFVFVFFHSVISHSVIHFQSGLFLCFSHSVIHFQSGLFRSKL